MRFVLAMTCAALFVAVAPASATPSLDEVNSIRATCGLPSVSSDGIAAQTELTRMIADPDLQLSETLTSVRFGLEIRWPDAENIPDQWSSVLWRSGFAPAATTYAPLDRSFTAAEVIRFIPSARMTMLDPRLASYDASPAGESADLARYRIDPSLPFTAPVRFPCGVAPVSPLQRDPVSLLLPPGVAAAPIKLRDASSGRSVDMAQAMFCGPDSISAETTCEYGIEGSHLMTLRANQLAQLPFAKTFRGNAGPHAVVVATSAAPPVLLRRGPVVRKGPRAAGEAMTRQAIVDLPPAMRPVARQVDGTMTIEKDWTDGLGFNLSCARDLNGDVSSFPCIYTFQFGSTSTQRFNAVQALGHATWRSGVNNTATINRFHKLLTAAHKRTNRPLGAPCIPGVRNQHCYSPEYKFTTEYMAAAGRPVAPSSGRAVLTPAQFQRFLTREFMLTAAAVNCDATKLCL